jgi:hypothetical protein
VGTFSDHLSKGKSNIYFLSQINSNIGLNWDWHVTISFYSALHLLSAHVVSKTGKNHLSHTALQEALNFQNPLSISKVDQTTYLAYTKLYQLSRRARYLVHDDSAQNKGVDIIDCQLTVDKHFRKAIKHLDVIMNYITNNYDVEFTKAEIRCKELNNIEFNHFTVVNI